MRPYITCHSRESVNPSMVSQKRECLDSRFRGNDNCENPK